MSTTRQYPIGGYAPGNYTCTCAFCKEKFQGDKRAVQCEPCAIAMIEKSEAVEADIIKTQAENPKGLHQRYFIQKIVRNQLRPTDRNAEYFVLRLDENGKDPKHIEACRIAVNAYADAIQEHIPELAKDIKERYPLNK